MSKIYLERKALLKSGDLVEHMEKRGIEFNVMTKEEARDFLVDNNNYFKLTSYRKNFLKHNEGVKKGKYINLDFAYLVDLSTIDMYIRNYFLRLTLDIEHYIKVNLLAEIEENDSEDGYHIVDEYISSKQEGESNKVVSDIRKSSGSPYCGELLAKYGIDKDTHHICDFPVWVFVEVISFGTLKDFYQFYYRYYNEKDKHNIGYLLWTVNQLRNAVAHNNCVLNNLYPNHPSSISNINIDNRVSNFLTHLNVGNTMKKSKMKNPRLNQMVTTLFVFDKVVTSDRIKKYRYKELYDLVNGRMIYKKEYYKSNETIKSTYEFIRKISINLYKEYIE